MKKQGFLIALGCACMIAVSTFVACNEKEENEYVNRSLNKKLLEESSDITGTFTLMNGKVEYDLYVLNGRLISSTNVSTGNVYKTKQVVICDSKFPKTEAGGLAASARASVLQEKYNMPCVVAFEVYNKEEKCKEYAVFYTVDEPCDWIEELEKQ